MRRAVLGARTWGSLGCRGAEVRLVRRLVRMRSRRGEQGENDCHMLPKGSLASRSETLHRGIAGSLVVGWPRQCLPKKNNLEFIEHTNIEFFWGLMQY